MLTANDTILVIDDEAQICRLVEIALSAEGYKVVEAATGKEGLSMVTSHNLSLVILDLGLPDMDGMEVLARLREWFHKPVVILSARNLEEDIVGALDSGANDYLTKPFRMGELLARVRASLRLNRLPDDNQLFEMGDLSVDISKHVAKKRDRVLDLTPTEFSLLSLLVRNQGCVLTHQYILREIWGYGHIEQTQYLRVFVAQLRRKIEDDPTRPVILVTESGIGYRFGV